jgi:hypothetical protein
MCHLPEECAPSRIPAQAIIPITAVITLVLIATVLLNCQISRRTQHTRQQQYQVHAQLPAHSPHVPSSSGSSLASLHQSCVLVVPPAHMARQRKPEAELSFANNLVMPLGTVQRHGNGELGSGRLCGTDSLPPGVGSLWPASEALQDAGPPSSSEHLNGHIQVSLHCKDELSADGPSSFLPQVDAMHQLVDTCKSIMDSKRTAIYARR